MKLKQGVKLKESGSIIMIPNDIIYPNPNQPRKNFDYNELEGLAASIRHSGIIQPLVVRKIDDDKYELISGERRLRAARMVGLLAVPCIIMSVNNDESALFSIIENIQRENLNFFEEAQSIEKLFSVYNMSQNEIARKLGKSQSFLSNKLRLLRLNEKIRNKVINAGLTERHARALLKLDTDEKRMKALEYIIEKNLNVSETDSYIESIISPSVKKPQPKFKKLKDIKIFINTINHAVDTMRRAGINANSSEHETSEYYEYVVRIPKTASSPVSFVKYSDDAV